MESEDKNNEPFEILIFEGNDAASAAENMRIGLAAKFKQFIKEGRPMKPCGAPVVFKEDNFFKIMVLLWLDHAFLLLSTMPPPNFGMDDDFDNPCTHTCGYQKTDYGLFCKDCGDPLV